MIEVSTLEDQMSWGWEKHVDAPHRDYHRVR